MEKTSGSIQYQDQDGNHVEEALMTYSEEERQQNIINKENAQAMWRPEFIPIYMEEEEAYNLSPLESKLYGFIRFFTKRNKKMYMSNESVAFNLRCAESTVTDLFKKLRKCGLIECSYKIKAGGGKIRIIKNVKTLDSQTTGSDQGNLPNPPVDPSRNQSVDPVLNQPVDPDIHNKKILKENINKKILSKDNRETSQEYGNPDINKVLEIVKSTFKLPMLDGTQKANRNAAFNLIRKIEKSLKEKKGSAERKEVLDFIETVCIAASSDDFWHNKITSIQTLYNKFVTLASLNRNQNGQSSKHVII